MLTCQVVSSQTQETGLLTPGNMLLSTIIAQGQVSDAQGKEVIIGLDHGLMQSHMHISTKRYVPH